MNGPAERYAVANRIWAVMGNGTDVGRLDFAPATAVDYPQISRGAGGAIFHRDGKGSIAKRSSDKPFNDRPVKDRFFLVQAAEQRTLFY